MDHTRRTLLAALAASAALAPVAGAAPGWTDPVGISATGTPAADAAVGIDAGGVATAVWRESNGLDDETVIVATRSPGGTWTGRQALSGAGFILSPTIAVAPSGAAVAAWTRDDTPTTDVGLMVEATIRPSATAPWEPVTTFTVDTEDAIDIQAGIDDAGNATVAWVRDTRQTPPDPLTVRTIRYSGGAWGAPQNVSDGVTDADLPRLAVTPSGTGVIIYRQASAGEPLDKVIHSATRTGGADWTGEGERSVPFTDATEALGSDDEGEAFDPAIARGPNGGAVATWTRYDDARHPIVQAVTRSAAGVWGTRAEISTAGKAATPPDARIDGSGNATVVWAEPDTFGTDIVHARTLGAGGSTGPAVPLSAPDVPAAAAHLAVAPDGATVAVWSRSNTVVQAARRPAGATAWTGAVDVTNPDEAGDEPRVVIDGSGNAVTVWTASTPTEPSEVRSALFDAAPPTLSIALPQTGTVGVPVAMSAAGTDAWTGLGARTWSFGDGASDTGLTSSHAYAAPGTYTVTVTQADLAGNTTVASGQITVAAAPVVTPPAPPVPPTTTPPGTTPPATAKLTISGLRGSCQKLSGRPCRPAVRFTLSVGGTVTITLKRSNGSVVGAISRIGRAGSNTITLPARLGTKAIGRGVYRVTVVARSGSQITPKATTGAIAVK